MQFLPRGGKIGIFKEKKAQILAEHQILLLLNQETGINMKSLDIVIG